MISDVVVCCELCCDRRIVYVVGVGVVVVVVVVRVRREERESPSVCVSAL